MGAGDENSRRKTEAAGSCFQQRVLLRPERLSRSPGGRGGVALRAAGRGRGAARGPAPSERYPRGSKAVPDLRGAELLLHRLLVGKPLRRLEAGERGHRAAVSEEPGREEPVGARSRPLPFGPRASRRMGPRLPLTLRREGCPPAQLFPSPPPGPLPCPRRSLRPSARVAVAWVSPRKGRLGLAEAAGRRPGRGGPPPAAEVTVREIKRRHEFLYPLQSSAPVLQGRRRRHRRALAALPEGLCRCRHGPRPGTKGSGVRRAPFGPGQLFVEHWRLSEAPPRGTQSEPLSRERGFRGSPPALPNPRATGQIPQ